MAERLAPVTVDAPALLSPELAVPSRWRWLRRGLFTGLLLTALAAGTLGVAHFLSIERRAHEVRATSLVPLGMPARVLVVLARPGQELPLAGTLAALDEAGTEVSLLALTAGSESVDSAGGAGAGASAPGVQAPADVPVPPALASAAERLGIDAVAVAGFPSGGLLAADPGQVTARIASAIGATHPSAILTPDDLTGTDSDTQATAGYVTAAGTSPQAGVGRIWTVARGAWEDGWLSLAGGVTPDASAPRPEVAVPLRPETRAAKAGAVADYARSGAGSVVRSSYPFADQVPGSLYFRFWDREYLALAWGTALE